MIEQSQRRIQSGTNRYGLREIILFVLQQIEDLVRIELKQLQIPIQQSTDEHHAVVSIIARPREVVDGTQQIDQKCRQKRVLKVAFGISFVFVTN